MIYAQDGLEISTPKSKEKMVNKFSTVMTSPRPALQECIGFCHENAPAPKALSSDLQSTDAYVTK